MKKLILFAALLLLLSSCGGTKKKPAAERLEAGEQVFANLAVSSVSDPLILARAEYLRDSFEEMGVTFDFANSNNDNSVMVSQIRKFVENESDIIICAPSDPDNLEEAMSEVISEAIKKGIPVVMSGVQMPSSYAETVSGAIYTDWYEIGIEIIQMAAAWTDSSPLGPKTAHAAVLGDAGQSFDEFNRGILAQLENDARINVTFNRNNLQTPEAGMEAVEAALAHDPEIKIFICFQESVSLGISDYILNSEELDPSEFACFSPDNPSIGQGETERSKINESILRGVISSGIFSREKNLSFDNASFLIAKQLLLGTDLPKPLVLTADRRAVNGFGYDYMHDNPQNDFLLELS